MFGGCQTLSMGNEDTPQIKTFYDPAVLGAVSGNPDLTKQIAENLARYCADHPQEGADILHTILDELASLQEQLKVAEQIALTDGLTGLYNMRYFEKAMMELDNTSVLSKRTPSGRHYLLLIDLDGFKPLNDTYGHPAGNAALQHMSNTLKDLVRKTDTVCRIGGDEFAIVLKDATEEGAHKKIAEIARSLKNMSYVYEGTQISFSGSVGHTEINPSAIRTMEDILNEADRRLYQNKETGRSIVSSQDKPSKGHRPEPSA